MKGDKNWEWPWLSGSSLLNRTYDVLHIDGPDLRRVDFVLTFQLCT